MTEPTLVSPVEERPLRNGLYPRQSFAKPHRVQVMQAASWVAFVLLIGGSAAFAVMGIAGALWMLRTFFDLLVRH